MSPSFLLPQYPGLSRPGPGQPDLPIYPGLSGVLGFCWPSWCRGPESESEVAQSCPTLCNLVDYSLPGSSVHGILQARMLEWVAFPSPGIFPTQGSNPSLPHCRQTLYCLSYQGSPEINAYPGLSPRLSRQTFHWLNHPQPFQD